MRWLDYAWRVPVTGIAFLCIFFGGGVLAVCLRPVLALSRSNRRERTQRAIHFLFRFYLRWLHVCGLLRIEISGAKQLAEAPGHLIVANHPSLLDVVILTSLIPRAQCIVKHQLWQHRFLGPLMRQAGYISNTLGGEEIIAACRESLAAGDSLIVFPEGTRSRPGQPITLQRGFAHLATHTGAPILPVTITVDPPTLMKGDPWWRIPARAPLFRVSVGLPVEAEKFSIGVSRGLAARRIVKYFENYYGTQHEHT